MASPNILVVEDDRETRALIARYLRTNACNVTTATDGREMVRAMTDHRVDLLILDVMLPGEDGLSLCRKVRAESQMPIIMLTARGEDVDRIVGLEMGADDYLAKPFNPRELLARLRAILRRRIRGHASTERSLHFGRLEIDIAARAVHVDGVQRELTGYQFDLLVALADKAGRVLSREALMDLVKGERLDAFDRSIDVHMSRIRAAIEDDPKKPRRIITVRGAGYVFAKAQD
jgi:two-component system OmpR family response regulator